MCAADAQRCCDDDEEEDAYLTQSLCSGSSMYPHYIASE